MRRVFLVNPILESPFLSCSVAYSLGKSDLSGINPPPMDRFQQDFWELAPSVWQSLFVLPQNHLIPWFSSSMDAPQRGINFPNLLLALHVLGFKCSSFLWQGGG